MIYAGRLRHRITIQQNTPTRDAHGGEVDSWGAVTTVWAEISPLNGKEYFTAKQETAEITHKVRLRYNNALSGITPKMRVLFGSRTLDIESAINPQERNKEIILMCRERFE